MAYNEFAYFYDEFNGEADYDALYAHIHAKLKEHGIHDGILADLGCGSEKKLLPVSESLPYVQQTTLSHIFLNQKQPKMFSRCPLQPE